jgi:hypothetical protein
VLPSTLAESDSPALARLRQQHTPRRRREQTGVPGWLWAILGAAVFIVVILFAVALLK